MLKLAIHAMLFWNKSNYMKSLKKTCRLQTSLVPISNNKLTKVTTVT